ncbi:MAG: helix-turn-helix domain-containing protein [Bacteroidales bacterium]
MNNIFAKRLTTARIMQGLSMGGLVEKINKIVSKQSISKYEAGKMIPDSTVLIALANALNVKIDYFFRPFTASLDKIEFRKKARLKIRELDSIKEKIRDKIERYIETENICGLSSDFSRSLSNTTVHNQDNIFTITSQLKKEWQLGEDGINNLIEILEEKNIKVIEIDAPNSFDGLSGFVGKKCPIIVLNKTFDAERKRFTALHELGHILLEFNSNIDKKQQENYCNLFANEMLISKEVFRQKMGADLRKNISLQELRDIQRQFGISIDALMFKARTLDMISENRYQYYFIKKNKEQSFKQAVHQAIYKAEQSTRFERLVYRALAIEAISLSKAATLLNLPIENVYKNLSLV